MVAFVAAMICLLAALLSAALFCINLRLYRPPPDVGEGAGEPLSILIPARNEARGIAATLEAALATQEIDFEVVVLDDHSTDETAEIVRAFRQRSERVRLESAPPLPAGWCGKQHACWVLAQHARHELLLFLDADVRLAPRGAAQAARFLRQSGAGLVSGVPRQETGGLLEKLLIPLIHFLLLGYLPMWIMRRSLQEGLGAGCGQLFLTTRQAYERAGGHAAIRESLHDGIRLPRAYRAAGIRTDLFDATDTAVCRMYRSAGETWRGLSKNATEGAASRATILPFTLLFGLGHVAPTAMLIAAAARGELHLPYGWAAIGATGLSYLPRILGCLVFRQTVIGAALHPIGVAVFLALQWRAFFAKVFGGQVGWKDRAYATPNASKASASGVGR